MFPAGAKTTSLPSKKVWPTYERPLDSASSNETDAEKPLPSASVTAKRFVVVVGSSTEEPIYPSIKGMMAAKKKPVEKVAAPPRGESRLSWSEPTAPQREAEGIIVQGESAQDAAAKLVAWMRENKLVAG